MRAIQITKTIAAIRLHAVWALARRNGDPVEQCPDIMADDFSTSHLYDQAAWSKVDLGSDTTQIDGAFIILAQRPPSWWWNRREAIDAAVVGMEKIKAADSSPGAGYRDVYLPLCDALGLKNEQWPKVAA